MRVSKLTFGKIPANTNCPFVGRCAHAERGVCNHKGEQHDVDFSCAVARAHDLIEMNAADHSDRGAFA